MRDQPGWLASDELDWILDYPRQVLPQTYFCPRARWCAVTSAFIYFQGLTPDFRHHTSVTWFLIVDGAWVQLDLSVGDAWATVGATGLKTLFCYGPPEIFGYIPAFVARVTNLIALPAHEIQAVPVPFRTPPGMCGWSLLHGFFQRMQLVLPDTPHAFLDILASTRHRELVRVIKGTDFAFWENSGVPADTVDFAYDVRNGFLRRILEGRTTEAFDCAGGVDDAAGKIEPTSTAPSAAKANATQDPWAAGDPWSKKPRRLFSTKWEDLLLPGKHPVLDAKGNMLDQTHKLQMSARKAGAVLATKSSIADLVRTAPNAPSVVILPNAEKSTFGEFAAKLLGPFELVLKDPALGSEYKRLALLLPLHGSITYGLPKPSVSLTATEVTEIVAGIDARLLSAQELDAVKTAPLDYIRSTVFAQHPALKDSLTFYALRLGKHPTTEKHEPQWQCIIKAPLKQRQALLSSSGVQTVLLRDYLDKQHSHTDLSVVPKFWPPSSRDLAEIRIVTQNTAGFAGIALTRRGLAVRAWNDNIASIRRAVLPTDPRLTKENMSVVPKFPFKSSGWPPAIEPCFVVTSTLQATGVAPIPTRAFRTGGVYSWSLAFDAKPSVLRFTPHLRFCWSKRASCHRRGLQSHSRIRPRFRNRVQGTHPTMRRPPVRLSRQLPPSLPSPIALQSLRSASTSLSKGKFVLKAKLMQDSRRFPPLSASCCKLRRREPGTLPVKHRLPNMLAKKARFDGVCQCGLPGLFVLRWIFFVFASLASSLLILPASRAFCIWFQPCPFGPWFGSLHWCRAVQCASAFSLLGLPSKLFGSSVSCFLSTSLREPIHADLVS